MHYILPKDRNQTFLFNSLEAMIPEVHPIRLIDEIVSNIVYNNQEKFKYKGQKRLGRPSYSPATMLKLFVYGYLNSIGSSRKLEAETHRNIEVKWLLGDLQPDFKTIADYRKDNGDQIRTVTLEFRKFLKQFGYIKGKNAVVDGCKVKANAKRDMLNLSRIERRLQNLDEKLLKYLKYLEHTDIEENLFEEIESIDPSSVHQHLIEKISLLQSKILKLEQQKQDLHSAGKKYLSPTDRDANLMKSRDGKIPAYNVETVVDAEFHMITEAQASTSPTDSKELEPLLDSIKADLEFELAEVTGDKGFYYQSEIKRLEEKFETKFYIPWQSRRQDKNKITFTYDKEHDEYLCPNGKSLKLKQKNKPKNGTYADMYQCTECNDCPFRSKCTTSKKGRIIYRYHDHVWRDNYKKRIKSEYGKKMIKKRKEIVEHVFGTIKCWMGKIPLLLRGRDKVQIEIDLYATAYNLRRLMNITKLDNLLEMVKRYDWIIDKIELNSAISNFFSYFKLSWNFYH